MTPLAILEKVAKRDADFVKAASSSSNRKNAFIRETLLKRKQLQYALKQLGFYASGIDGLWRNGTASALTNYQSEESLLSSSSSQVFRRILNEVDVPSSFAAPKKKLSNNLSGTNTTNGWVPLAGTPKLNFKDAKDICEARAVAAGNSYMSANRPTRRNSGSFSCNSIGSFTNCGRISGGWAEGALNALDSVAPVSSLVSIPSSFVNTYITASLLPFAALVI